MAVEKRAISRKDIVCRRRGPEWPHKHLQRVHRGLLLAWRRGRNVPALPGGKVWHFRELNGRLHRPVRCGHVFYGRRHFIWLHDLPRGLLLRGWRVAGGLQPGDLLHFGPSLQR